jgi:hypothetical protein
MHQNLSRLALAAALTLGAAAAQAATLTLSSWTWGNGNAAQSTFPTQQTYNGLAGGFSGTLTGSGTDGLDGGVLTYCVELRQSFVWNRAYTDVTLTGAADYFGLTGDRAGRLGSLLSYVEDLGLFGAAAAGTKDNFSTSLQLAIWNIVYDTDTTVAGGAFKDTGASATLASSLLAASAGWENRYDLWVLATPTGQDQLIWRDRPEESSHVPEPASLALASLALAGLAVGRRRRR